MGLEVNAGAGPMPKCRNGTPAAWLLKSQFFWGRMVLSVWSQQWPRFGHKSWGIGDIVKATRRQRVKVERQSKATRETTAIIKSNGSDLMSEKGNLDFGI